MYKVVAKFKLNHTFPLCVILSIVPTTYIHSSRFQAAIHFVFSYNNAKILGNEGLYGCTKLNLLEFDQPRQADSEAQTTYPARITPKRTLN